MKRIIVAFFRERLGRLHYSTQSKNLSARGGLPLSFCSNNNSVTSPLIGSCDIGALEVSNSFL